jgi:hypothetical protein
MARKVDLKIDPNLKVSLMIWRPSRVGVVAKKAIWSKIVDPRQRQVIFNKQTWLLLVLRGIFLWMIFLYDGLIVPFAHHQGNLVIHRFLIVHILIIFVTFKSFLVLFLGLADQFSWGMINLVKLKGLDLLRFICLIESYVLWLILGLYQIWGRIWFLWEY